MIVFIVIYENKSRYSLNFDHLNFSNKLEIKVLLLLLKKPYSFLLRDS